MSRLKISITTTVCLCCLVAVGQGADRVKLLAGNQSSGKITEITPTEIHLELGATKKTFAVNEIDTITFDAEPNELAQARIAVHAGRFGDAVALLSKLGKDDVSRKEIAADVDFYKAYAAVRLALAGDGSKADAGRQLFAFEKAHKNSYHYFETCEALGDLFAALGKFDQAETYYNKLAAAPWPDYKLRADVLVGRALVGQKSYDRALAKFDDVLAADAKGKDAERQKLAATLGKAAALAGNGKSDQAIQSVEQVIAKADPENQELHARAYNILGNCYLAAGKKKDALLAFLHVDLLYARFPEQHAEALANLATLWAEVDKADRAAQAQATLNEKYPGSVWATK
jgi:tetratricopeptide (TPR) repeat protein